MGGVCTLSTAQIRRQVCPILQMSMTININIGITTSNGRRDQHSPNDRDADP